MLSGIGFSSGVLRMESMNAEEVLQVLLWRCDSVWDLLDRYPRVCITRVILTTYHRWMYDRKWLDRPGYLFLRLGYRQMYMFIRFKLGCHHLTIQTGRWHAYGIPRADRLGPRCNMSTLDDERHLEVECPVFGIVRKPHCQLFGSEVTLDCCRRVHSRGLLEVH